MGKSTKLSNHRTSNILSALSGNSVSRINYIFILLIAGFLIVGPFFRGLYFREDYILSIVYMSATFVLYVLYKLMRKDDSLVSSYLDIAMLSLPIAYLVSFFFSINSMDAMDAVLKYAAYFMIYKIVSDLGREIIYRKALEYTVMTAMLVMAGADLLAALGYLELNGVIMYHRIYGLYQYSNATASAMGAAMFLAAGFALGSSKLYEKLFYFLTLAVAFPTFVLTFSRGAYLIFAILVLLNLILLESRKRIQFIYCMFTLVVSNILFIYEYYSNEAASGSAVYLFAGVIVFLTLQVIYEKLIIRYVDKISVKAVNVILLAAIVISATVISLVLSIKTPIEYKVEHAAGEEKTWKYLVLSVENIAPDKEYTVQFLAKSSVESENGSYIIIKSLDGTGNRSDILTKGNKVGNELEKIEYEFRTNKDSKSIELYIHNYEANSNTIYKDIQIQDDKGNIVKKFERFKYLPEALMERLSDFSLGTQSVSTRTYYIKDGIKIIKDYFLFGTGGGGWKNLYRRYQSLPYDSTEAHNFYLQHMIETGVVGLLVLLTVYVLLAKRAIVSIFKDRKYEQLPIYIALLMMMGHAVLDFDLSLTALAFLFWMMLGMAVPSDNQDKAFMSNDLIVKRIITITSIIVLLFSLSIFIGISQGDRAAKIYKKDVDKAIKLYESAMRRDPFNKNYHMDYMQIMFGQYQTKKDPVFMDKMRASLDNVMNSGLSDIKYNSVIVSQLLNLGDLEKAMAVTNDLVSKNPMVPEAYKFKIDVNYQIAKYYFANKQKEVAIPYLTNMIETGNQFDAINKMSIKPLVEPENLRSMIRLAENWISNAEKSESK